MGCLFCGNSLLEKQKKRGVKFCSRSCANRHRYRHVQKEYVCQRCGRKYTKKSSGTKVGTKYCSPECGRKHNEGRKFSDEHKRKISDAQKNIRREGDFKCPKCSSVFVSNTSLRAHVAHCGKEKQRYKCHGCGKEYKGLAGLQRHLVWCVDSECNVEQRRSVKNAVRAANARKLKDRDIHIGWVDTKPERELRSGLESAGIDVYCQFSIPGRNHCYDFLVRGLIVEVDGDYWHGNPARFELSSRQKKQFRIDETHTSVARMAGYNVVRYWESDILNRREDVVADIVGVLNGGKPKLARNM